MMAKWSNMGMMCENWPKIAKFSAKLLKTSDIEKKFFILFTRFLGQEKTLLRKSTKKSKVSQVLNNNPVISVCFLWSFPFSEKFFLCVDESDRLWNQSNLSVARGYVSQVRKWRVLIGHCASGGVLRQIPLPFCDLVKRTEITQIINEKWKLRWRVFFGTQNPTILYRNIHNFGNEFFA